MVLLSEIARYGRLGLGWAQSVTVQVISSIIYVATGPNALVAHASCADVMRMNPAEHAEPKTNGPTE